jgi:hypothetical protein
MDCAALQSQRRVRGGHQGFGNVWYAGAYLHYGFHEDGFRSGIEAARGLLKVRYGTARPVRASGDAWQLKWRKTGRTPCVLSLRLAAAPVLDCAMAITNVHLGGSSNPQFTAPLLFGLLLLG